MEREHSVVFECPGCGTAFTIRSTRMARVDWITVPNGGCVGWATCAHEDDEPHFAFIRGGGMSTTLHYSESPETVHDCSRRGNPGASVARA